MRRMSRARKGNVMTPETAHEKGRQAASALARIFCKEATCEDMTGTEGFSDADVLEAVEIFAAHEAGLSGPEVSHALRGAAEFWENFASELRARAAAIEATR